MIPSRAARPGVGRALAALCIVAAIGASPWGLHQAASGLTSASTGTTALASPDGSGTSPGGLMGGAAPGPVRAAAPPAAPDTQAPADAQASARDAVVVRASTAFYDVEGTDVSSLLSSLRQRGPHDDTGSWAASTGWTFSWAYRSVLDAGCRVEAPQVELELRYTYPQWAAPPNVAPAVSSAWDGYLAHIEAHEQGHREIAEQAAAELVQALDALPEQPTCDDLAASARVTADAVLVRHAHAQRDYDRETGHGATQGAVLKPEQ